MTSLTSGTNERSWHSVLMIPFAFHQCSGTQASLKAIGFGSEIHNTLHNGIMPQFEPFSFLLLKLSKLLLLHIMTLLAFFLFFVSFICHFVFIASDMGNFPFC